MKLLRRKASGSKLWVSIDESTDVEQLYVASLVFGVLGNEAEIGKYYLDNVAVLPKGIHSSIARFFNESMLCLWPDQIYYENVLLVCTDPAPYMT